MSNSFLLPSQNTFGKDSERGSIVPSLDVIHIKIGNGLVDIDRKRYEFKSQIQFQEKQDKMFTKTYQNPFFSNFSSSDVNFLHDLCQTENGGVNVQINVIYFCSSTTNVYNKSSRKKDYRKPGPFGTGGTGATVEIFYSV